MTTSLIDPVPKLVWTRTRPGLLTATDADSVHWGIVRHGTPPGAPRPAGGTPDGPRWWLHRLGEGDEPASYAAAPVVCEGDVEPSVPDVLRYADVLAAGWRSASWRVENGTAHGDLVMVREGRHAPVSALIGDPVLVHPQRLAESYARRCALELAQRRLEDLATVAHRAGTVLDPAVILTILAGGSPQEASDA
ncbi:hypothetical protein [Streptomyces hygroscopicus]|uniref:hypothetical protein n=1 Tax=Streptomyces hygroscopicus TaxID=1912 RepID=UPI000767CC8C|nr:hypothetical protein [Streptomyces hygroscopicus]